MSKKRELTQDRLHELFDYSPSTGLLTRLVDKARARAGAVAGTVHHSGYVVICIDGKLYLSHRLVWLYLYGRWPKAEIDHINGCRSDNRLSNLREATPSQNSHNELAPRRHNTSGLRGVHWHKRDRKWMASIRLNGKYQHLGYFTSELAAFSAYMAARAAHPFAPEQDAMTEQLHNYVNAKHDGILL